MAKDYHQLRRAVSFASFGKLRFKTEYEQDLWSECRRLIANCIIFYNASLLSRLLEHQEKSGDTQGAEAVKKISPIAWQHINLHGRYEFQKSARPLRRGRNHPGDDRIPPISSHGAGGMNLD